MTPPVIEWTSLGHTGYMPAGFTSGVYPAGALVNPRRQMTNPPSMFQVTPVMNPDSGWARYATALAMSRGCP